MTEPTKLFAVVSWILLPLVMLGGYSILRRKRHDDAWLTPFRETYFRAGHAHAGVLLALSLIYYIYLAQTTFSDSTKIIACVLYLLGVLAQSGGFFVTMLFGKPGTSSPGFVVTVLGA